MAAELDVNPSSHLGTRQGLAIDRDRALWLDPATIALPHAALPTRHHRMPARPHHDPRWLLLWSPQAQVRIDEQGLHAPDLHVVALEEEPAGMGTDLRRRHPHLAGHAALRVPPQWHHSIPEMLTGQLLLGHRDEGVLDWLTGIQLGPVIDAVHGHRARERQLGPVFGADRIDLALWAPTAQQVSLLLWPTDAGEAPSTGAERRTMRRSADGTWCARLPREAEGSRYLFEVRVHSPATRRLETNLVTDPYSTALGVDSQHSVLVDLADPRWMPHDWQRSTGPRLERLVDAAVYELHVRDFSACDELVPEHLRGSYLAFERDGHGSRHLRSLARAGLNTVHLLPCFDVTSIPEAHPVPQPDEQQLRALPPDSHEQQRLVSATAGQDAYNWGYDPFHWGVPEGSYASSPESADGGQRVLEFRRMVQALHGMGLRVVLDQVFTHTAASGQHPCSVLDRIVPGYHHRLDPSGAPEGSAAGNNVATERVMAEKLMVDMVLRWARDYRVDGFRFDLMGHSSAATMARVRRALDGLTPERDGVDGKGSYLYGEGWNFGEVADNAQFIQAVQGQLAGTGIATFNDRLRDAVRGGQPFDEDPRRQGLGSGLLCDPNGAPGNREARQALAHCTDLVMLGMAGNLCDYELACTDGVVRRGDQVWHEGRPAGYATEPYEVVNYVDAHDNETLWDALTLKLPRSMPMDQRIRMNTLCLATVALGQAPFLWHAGTDLLRSKSLDRNSYDSGDWFNRLDWTGADNGFGHGLPPASENMTRWHWLKPLLRDPALKPTAGDVAAARDQAAALLRLRRSTRLLRLGSAELVRQKVRFPLSGTAGALSSVVTMHVDDRVGQRVGGQLQGVVVVLNARGEQVEQRLPGLAGEHLVPSPVPHGTADGGPRCEDGVLVVPPRTVAVFTHPA